MLGIGMHTFKGQNVPGNPVVLGGLATVVVTDGGEFAVPDNQYSIVEGIRFTSSRPGVDGAIIVIVTSGVITGIFTIISPGSGYAVNDTITVTRVGGVDATKNATLTITAIT